MVPRNSSFSASALGLCNGCCSAKSSVSTSCEWSLRKEASMASFSKTRRSERLGRPSTLHLAELLLSPEPDHREEVNLTKTETEVLKDIALGLTTKEIASKRFSSFHTINTHRKNIFRKLGVNNAHEATKYALRAGLVDSAEYYI